MSNTGRRITQVDWTVPGRAGGRGRGRRRHRPSTAAPSSSRRCWSWLAEKPRRIVVDLSGVPYMDSSGVASLVKLLARARREGIGPEAGRAERRASAASSRSRGWTASSRSIADRAGGDGRVSMDGRQTNLVRDGSARPLLEGRALHRRACVLLAGRRRSLEARWWWSAARSASPARPGRPDGPRRRPQRRHRRAWCRCSSA